MQDIMVYWCRKEEKLMFALLDHWLLFGVLMPLGKANTSCTKPVQDLRVGTNTPTHPPKKKSFLIETKSTTATSLFFLLLVHRVKLCSFFRTSPTAVIKNIYVYIYLYNNNNKKELCTFALSHHNEIIHVGPMKTFLHICNM